MGMFGDLGFWRLVVPREGCRRGRHYWFPSSCGGCLEAILCLLPCLHCVFSMRVRVIAVVVAVGMHLCLRVGEQVRSFVVVIVVVVVAVIVVMIMMVVVLIL